jgi:hypothetical protein
LASRISSSLGRLVYKQRITEQEEDRKILQNFVNKVAWELPEHIVDARRVPKGHWLGPSVATAIALYQRHLTAAEQSWCQRWVAGGARAVDFVGGSLERQAFCSIYHALGNGDQAALTALLRAPDRHWEPY